MRLRPIHSLTTVLMLASACGRREQSAQADASAIRTTPAVSGGMTSMGSMAEAQRDTVLERTEADLKRLDAASADSLRAMLPAHRQVVTDLIADCERMMQGMKMHPPGKWHTATSALRADLERMVSMSPAQLRTYWPQHRGHVDAVLAMRRDMMKEMKPM